MFPALAWSCLVATSVTTTSEKLRFFLAADSRGRPLTLNGRRGTKKNDQMILKWGPWALKLLFFMYRVHVFFLFGCLGFCWSDVSLLSTILGIFFVVFLSLHVWYHLLPERIDGRAKHGPRFSRFYLLWVVYFGFSLESSISSQNDVEFASRDFKIAVANVICMFHLCFWDRVYSESFPFLLWFFWLFVLYLSLSLYAGCINQGESRAARSVARRFYLLRGACPVCLELFFCVEWHFGLSVSLSQCVVF